MATPATRAKVRLTNEAFDRLVAEGVLREGSRTYLWDGEIIEPIPEEMPHANAIHHLWRLLDRRLPEDDWMLTQGRPIVLAEGFQPQPDLSVHRGPRSNYRRHKPTPVDVALLVEVSDTTYPNDAGPVLHKFAQEGIPQYWIVNIRARSVEVYKEPDRARGTYLSRATYGMGETVPLVLGEAAEFAGVPVEEILRDSLEEG